MEPFFTFITIIIVFGCIIMIFAKYNKNKYFY
jgi:hypothetical protein